MTVNIVDLARTILTQVETINTSLKASGQPDLSFGLDGGEIPLSDPSAQMAKEIARSTALQLATLLGGPSGRVQDLVFATSDVTAIQVIQRFQIANSFPVGETSTYAAIATTCGIPEDRARRILQYAMTSGIFVEVQPGVIAHTAMSRALAEDPRVRSEGGVFWDEQFPAGAHLAESLEKFGASEEATEAGWALANRASKPMFAELQDKYPVRAQQFTDFMDIWATIHSTQPLIEMVDWTSIAAAAQTSTPTHLVDIGGGKGHVCSSLAQALPDFTFTVQDYAETIAGASAALPAEVRERITYQVHDFLTDSQPVHGADVYFFRSVFHDWPEKDCVRILRNLIPALKPGARVILNELCEMTSVPLIPPLQRVTRCLDLIMLVLFNGKERSRDDFERIFAKADPRFEFVSAKEPVLDPKNGLPSRGLMSIIEVVWRG